MLNVRNRVVVVGAGYGGLRVAQRLGRYFHHQERGELVVVDQHDYHLHEVKLHQVTAASIEPERVTIPFDRLIDDRQIQFLQARVTGFDYARKTVFTDSSEITYDTLVVALGSETDFFGIPGMEQYALTLKSLDEAIRIREHIRNAFASTLNLQDVDGRRTLLTFVVGGGGFTGTELAAELADWLPSLCQNYRVDRRDVRLMVVEAGPSILPGFDPELVDKALKVLARKGIQVILSTPVVEAGSHHIRLKSGETITTNTIIWTGGVRGRPLVSNSGLTTGSRGRVVVNPYLESVDYPGVYIVGDSALVVDHATNRPVAPSAQVALEEAAAVADNIRAALEGQPRRAFEPHLRGEFVSLGRDNGVGVLGGIKLSGRLAILLKRVNEYRYLVEIGGLTLAWRYLVGTPPARAERATGALQESSDGIDQRRRVSK